jgi:hypothetical protein
MGAKKNAKKKELISSDKADGHGPRHRQFELGTAGFAFRLVGTHEFID